MTGSWQNSGRSVATNRAKAASAAFPGLYRVTAKGREYFYAWRNGPAILAPYGTPEFAAEFWALKSPHSALDRTKFSAWVTLYRNEKEPLGGTPFCKLAPSTQKQWGRMLDTISSYFGTLSVKYFDRPMIRTDIRKFRNQWAEKPRTADYAKQVLSRVLGFMVASGALRSNPCEGVENLYRNNRASIIWTADDMAALAATTSKEIMFAARLAALTGLRQDDCLTLKWDEIGEKEIVKPTGKSRGKRIARVPLYGDLRALLAEIPNRSAYVLTNSRGKPWEGFNSSWSTAVERAGLSGLHFHDLRGNAATTLYALDFSYSEIADIIGVSEAEVRKWIETYVNRDKIADERIARFEGRRAESGFAANS